MRRLLFVLASIIAVLTFSCDTTQPDFDDSVPGVNTLTTTVSPEGGGEVFPSDGEFVEGTSIEIEAVPNTGYTFDRWEGDLVGSLNPTFLSMTENRSVTAFFSEIEVPLTINIVGEGSVEQEIIEQEQDETAAAATTILQTEEPSDTLQINSKGDRNLQLRQNDEVSDGRQIDGVDSERERQRKTIPDEGAEQTQIPQQQVQTQARKAITTIQLTANPEEGWEFSRWEGDLTGSQNPDTLVVEEETVVTAVFEQETTETFSLELTVEGQGFIEAVPDKLEYDAGEEVTLTATPEDGWQFSQWGGDLSGSENPETIIMDSDKQVTSQFVMEGSASIEIVQQPSQTVAGETISPAPAVRFTDSDGEPEQGVNIQATLNAESFSGGSETTVSTNADGIATFDQLSVETAGGNYRIEFEALDSDVSTLTTSQFTIVPAAGDPAESSVSVPDGIAGETTTIDIFVNDRFENPVSDAGDQLEVTVTGANSATPDVTAGEQAGLYIAEYTPQNAGNDQIAVALNGTDISGTPVESEVTASDVSGENSSAEITPEELTVGQEATITVTARDDQNNPLSGIEDEIEVSGAGDATVSSFTEEGQSGVYSATVNNTVPGELSLTVTVSGVTLEPALFITFLTGSAENIEIVSGNNQSASVGSELANPVIVRVTDAFDNPVEGETVTFEFDETPPAAAGRSIEPESATTNADGEASSVVTLGIIPGDYTVEASAENAGAVTFNFQATIGQASAISITSQPTAAVAGETIAPSPAVKITDDEGNGIEGVEVSAGLDGGSFTEESTLQVSTNSSGVAEFSNLTITEAGTGYAITFTPAPSSVSEVTSDLFEVTAAAADPANSTADVPNGSAGDETEISITLLDTFGNPVDGATDQISVEVSSGPNSGAEFSSINDSGEGVYQTAYTPETIGTDEITISVNGTEVEGSPFSSSVITTDAELVEVSNQPGNTVAGTVIPGSPSVLVTDNNGNPVADVEVTVSADGTSIAGGTTTQTTGVSGEAEFNDLVIETVGSFRLEFNALGVSDPAFSEQFEITNADADQISISSGNDQTGIVAEALNNPFVAEVTDPFGNTVPGFEVEFSIDETPSGASGQTLSSETVNTNSDGLASSTLTLGDLIGTYTVTAASAVGEVSFSATANPGDVDSFVFDEISTPQTAGSSFLVRITAFDEFENIAAGYGGTANLSTTAGTINPNNIAFEDGEASQSVTVSGAGPGQTITAADGSVSGTSNGFDVQTGGASNAEITQQPSNTTAGESISPPPAVEVTDGQGNPVNGVEVEAVPSSGSFASGTTTQTTSNNGIATFENLSIEAAGGYTITFDVDASGANDPESGEFTITPAGADPQNTDASVPDGVAGEETIILITAEDTFGNRVDGIASELAVSISGANDASPAAESIGEGQYEAVYTPVNSGEDQVAIELNGTSISRSPYSSTVSTSDISSSESSVSASPETVQAGNTSQVTVQLRDTNGNPISGLSSSDFNISVSGNGNAGSVSEISDGSYQFNVSNNTAQQVTVTVNADGLRLDDTPQITFTAAEPELIAIPSGSQPGTSVAGEIITNSPSVRVLDEFGNSVPDVSVTVSEEGGQAFASGTDEQSTNDNGIAVFDDLVIDQSGEYRLNFSTQVGLSTSSQPFVVEAAAADAGSSTANVPNGAAGDQTNITITVLDAFGNPVEGAGSNLSVTVSGANSGAETEPVSDNGNGEYSSAYTPVNSGTDQVAIELNGAGIQGSPFTSTVITSDADDVAMINQPENTTAGESINGNPSVEVTDSEGNPVGDIEVIVSANGPGSIAVGTTSVNTNSSGIAEFTGLLIETAGSYTLEFNAIGVSENAVSDPFEVEPAQASQISTTSGTNQSATVTDQLPDPFEVQVTDDFENPVSGHTVEFQLDQIPAGATGQQLSSSSVNTDQDGLAATSLTLGTIAGTYSVAVNAGSAGSATFSATAVAGEADTFSFDEITTPQTAGEPFGVSITALDSEGNTAREYGGSASLTTTAGSVTPATADFTNGTTSVDVTVSSAGPDQTLSAEDGAISGTSNAFDVQSGGVDEANSSVTANPTELRAGEPSELTIELRDGSNNTVTGSAGDISINLSGNANTGSVSEDGNGIYTADISNQTAETVTVSVSVNGVTLDDSPSIEFTPADPDELVRVSGDDQTGAVTEQLSDDFIVRVDDAFDNAVDGAEVQFSITGSPAGASGQELSVTNPETDAAGEASTRLTLGDTPGTYTIEAAVSGLGTVTFTAEAETGTPSQMDIVTQPENTAAGETIAPSPQVQITDNAGNPVEGINVTVSESSGYTFDNGTLTRPTDGSGVATFGDLIIEEAGSYTLDFDADAGSVADVQSNSFDVTAAAGAPQNSTATVPDGVAGEPTTISITVRDEFDNPVTGAASGLSVDVSGANSASPDVSESGSGEYTASYTPILPGTDDIVIELGGSGISGSPYTSEVSTSDISSSESVVTANPTTLQAGNSSTVSVQVNDAVGNAISGLSGSDFTIQVSGDASANAVSETSTSGTYEFTLENETAEQVQVTVEVRGTVLDDTPQITFNAGDPDDITMESQPGNAVAGQTIPGSPSVSVTDAFNNPVPGIDVTITEQGGEEFASGSEVITTNEDGFVVFTDLVINTAGQYNFVFTAVGGVTVTSNAFTVDAAEADVASTTADVPNGAATNQTNITITVEDSFGNRVEGEAGNLAVSVGGENDGASVDPISDDGNGIYTTGYTPTSSGEDQITITLNGDDIAGSPYTSEVVTSDAENVAFETQPQQTVAGQPIAGPPSARVTDSGDNNVPGVEVIAGLQSGSFDSGTTSLNTDGSGIAAFSDLVINTAGSYIMEFNAVGVNEDAASESFEVVAADADELGIADGNDQTATVTETLAEPLVVQVTDAFGNAVEGEEISFTISDAPAGTTGQDLSAATAQTDSNGFASTELTLGSTAGTYEITATADGLDVAIFTATADAGDAATFAFETISSPQVAGSPFEITITALDAQGNVAAGYGATASLSSSAGSVSPESATFSNGNAVLDVSVSNAGSDQTITAEDGSITGTSNAFDVQTGGVDAANSSVSADPLSLQAGQSSTLSIELRDGSNNIVTGVDAENFDISLTGDATAGTITEPTAGTYTADITNQTAETVTASVTASGTQLNETPEIEFTPADADPAATTANVPNGAAGDATDITISVVDEFGNPISDSADDLGISVSDGPNAGASFTTISSNGDGTYTTSYTPDAIGTDEITISLAGVEISGSPYSSVVTASDVSASNSSATANPETLEVGSPSTVTAEIRDGSDNPIAGLSSGDFNISVSGSGSSGSVSETDTDGTYEFTVSNETAETVTVSITATGTTLDNEPNITFTAGAPASIIVAPQPGDVAAGQTIPGPPTVTLEDAFDNPVPNIDVTVSEQGGQDFASGTLLVQTDASGEADFTDLVIETAGEYNLVFNEPGGETATSNIFNVSADAADAASTTADVPNGAATDFTSITITVEDPFGNRVTGVEGDLSVSVDGANSGTTVDAITDDGNGIYSTGYTPSSTGTDEVTITLNEVEIAGSPYSSNVVTSDAENVVVETEPIQTVAGQPIAGPPAARVTDAGDNNVSGVEVIAGLESGSFDSGTTSVNTDASGIAAFSDLVINAAGSYVMEFNAVGVTDDASSQPFEIVAADPANFVIDSGNNQTGNVTGTLGDAFVVEITDEFGNPVENETVEFAISSQPTDAAGASLTETSVATDANGEASTQLTLGNRSGTYQVTASADGLADVTFTATAEAGSASAYEFGAISTPQTAGQPFTISLTALDDQGNTADGYEEAVTLSASLGTISPTTADFTNGTVSLDVSLDQAGSDITITATDGTISETSAPFDVQTGGVDAVNSSASADPVQLEAGATSQLTIDLRDENNNAVSGLTDGDFTIGVSGSGSAGTVTETGTPGTYTTDIDNQTAETVTVSVTADETTLNDSPSIEFTPADASEVIQVSGNNQTGTVLDQLTEDFVIRVEDAFENPVEGESLSFEISGQPAGASGQTLSVGSATTDENGLAATRLTLGDEPGTYTVDGFVSGLNTVTFNADAEIGSASQMSVTAQPNQTTAGEVISPAPEVLVADNAGNPVEGVNVTVSEQSGAIFDAGTTTQTTNASGIATFSNLVFESADSYTLVFDADAPGVSNVTSDPLEVVPAAGDPVNSTAVVPDGVAGEVTDVTITVLDPFDNPVADESDILSASITNGANAGASFSEITGNGDGTYSTRYTPVNDGTDEVSITLDGASIAGSPFTSDVSTGDVSAANSDVSADPATLQAGNSSLITVDLRDASNNPISGLTSTDFSVAVTGAGNANSISESSTDGIYQFTVSNETAEPVTVTVSANGTTLQDTPEITFTAADPDLMLISGDPEPSIAGEPIAGPPAVTITDEFDNPVPNAEVNVTEQGGESFSTGSTTTVNTNGQGVASFTNIAIESVGQYNLVFASVGVTNRTSNVFDVVAAGPDAAQTTADVPNGSAGDQTNITITVRDEFENRVEGVADQLTLEIQGDNAGEQVAEITDNGNGVYSTGYTPESTGTDQVVIEVNGADIQGSPFESSVDNSDAENIAISQEPLETIAGNAIEGPPSVIVTDGFGNTVSGVEVTVSEQAGTGFDAGQLTVSTDGSGAAVFSDLQINSSGTYTLEFDAVGVATDAVSAIFDVVTDDGDPLQTTAVVPDGTSNEATTITVTVRDQFENSVIGAAGDLSASVTAGPNDTETFSAFQDDGDGSYSASYTPIDSGADEITITLGGTQISDNPYTSDVTAGAATTLQMGEQPTGKTAGTAIDPAPSVLLTDSEGNGVSGVNVTATLSSNNFTLASNTSVSTNQDGQAIFDNLVIETAETGYAITFSADAAGVADVTSGLFDVTAATASDINEISGGGQVSEVTTSLADPFIVEVVDPFGNRVAGETVGYAITGTPGGATGQSLSSSSVQSDSEGLASSLLTLGNVSGSYTTQASLGSETVSFSADATPGDATSYNFEEITSPQTAGTEFSITLQALDSEANVDTSYSGTATLSTTAGTISPASATFTDGVAIVSASVTDAGTGQTITADDGSISATSNGFDVNPGSVSSTASSANATSPHLADGTDASMVTINLTDANGNAISGLSDGDFLVDLGENATAGPVSEPAADGTYEFEVTNTTAETVTASIIAEGITLEDQPQIEFQAGPATSYQFDVISSPQSAGTPFEITITAQDDNANTAAGYNATAALTTTAGTIDPTSATFTDGVATVSVTAAEAGADQTITADDGSISATSGVFDVNPGSISSTASSASATSPHIANGTDASTVSINLTDENGNAISGLSDGDFTIDAGANATTGPVTETTTEGTYEVSVTNATAETVTVSIIADEITLEDQPQIEFQDVEASTLEILQQPGNSTSGSAITPAPAASLKNSEGIGLPDINVTALLNKNDFIGASTTTIATSNDGNAIFDNLVIAMADSGYSITFNADEPGVTDVISNNFDVTTGDADDIENDDEEDDNDD